MNLEHVAPGPVQPSHYDDVFAGREPLKTLRRERTHFEPGVGRTLRTLFGRFAARLKDGSDHTNRTKLGTSATLRACPHPR